KAKAGMLVRHAGARRLGPRSRFDRAGGSSSLFRRESTEAEASTGRREHRRGRAPKLETSTTRYVMVRRAFLGRVRAEHEPPRKAPEAPWTSFESTAKWLW